ncbi:MAG: radical SAM family heme chaperone HemW [Myxococcota bacterium]|nr:radical SAM family heme chaperone HemW [Myxococcota bacterium]
MGYPNAMTFGVYIHYPYCRRLCPYCDFNVFAVESRPDERYRDAVVKEMTRRRADFLDRPPVTSIYFGGGTPGMWAPKYIGEVITEISHNFGTAPGCEITVEFNPEDATVARCTQLLEAGVNRLSFGLQSFNDTILTGLGRVHRAADAVRAVNEARHAGFTNLSVDLIYGLHGQTVEQALDDVAQAIDEQVHHISTYQLTIESQTAFGVRARRGESLLVDEERLLLMFDQIRQALAEAGFCPYEISSAARPGYESVHNHLYWSGGEYLALGAGAHGFRRIGSGGIRWENLKNPKTYMTKTLANQPIEQWCEEISPSERLEERLWTGLRMDQGVLVSPELTLRFGANVQRLVDDGLMNMDHDRWRVTNAGRRILDTVIGQLLSEQVDEGN